MKRTSTDAEYLDSGKLVIDADGVPFEPASKGYVDQRVPIDSFTGTGSPEGKIEAPVGSVYTDTAATNGAIRWIKTSGTGNTGWRVEYGDTGLRDISNLLTNATGKVTLSRVGQVVYLTAVSVEPTEELRSGSTYLSALPVGFRPPAQRYYSAPTSLMSSTVRSSFQFTSGAMGAWVPSVGDKYNFEHSWITTNSWPTSLPGTPL